MVADHLSMIREVDVGAAFLSTFTLHYSGIGKNLGVFPSSPDLYTDTRVSSSYSVLYPRDRNGAYFHPLDKYNESQKYERRLLFHPIYRLAEYKI